MCRQFLAACPLSVAVCSALTEALRVELPAHGAQPGLPRLPLLQLPVQLLLQHHHVPAGAGLGGYLLHPELVRLLPFPAREAPPVTGVTGHPPGAAGPGPAPLTAAAGWRSGAPVAAACRRFPGGLPSAGDSAGTGEDSAVAAGRGPRYPPACPPSPLTAGEALSPRRDTRTGGQYRSSDSGGAAMAAAALSPLSPWRSRRRRRAAPRRRSNARAEAPRPEVLAGRKWRHFLRGRAPWRRRRRSGGESGGGGGRRR